MVRSDNSSPRTPRQQFAFWLLMAALMFAFSFTFLTGLVIFGSEHVRQFGIALTVLASACLSGGLVGFLFGVSNTTIENADHTHGPWNSHLVQIADWLTKIIVGLGLIEFRSILSGLHRLGEAFNPHLVGPVAAGTGDQWGTPVAIGLVLSGTIGAFSLIYLWTTTRLPEVWRQETPPAPAPAPAPEQATP